MLALRPAAVAAVVFWRCTIGVILGLDCGYIGALLSYVGVILGLYLTHPALTSG